VNRSPPLRERVTRQEVERRQGTLKGLKAWRIAEGKALGLDPSLLWPMISLERLARAPGTLDEEIGAPEVRQWQRRHVAAKLISWMKSYTEFDKEPPKILTRPGGSPYNAQSEQAVR